jgi:hypothetical protein
MVLPNYPDEMLYAIVLGRLNFLKMDVTSARISPSYSFMAYIRKKVVNER